eukprot:CAMPEP_0117562952 /NCGR_PEP_ID=MMETSP0784-20121206/55239_1 /TAXON_ID=39447 /ORGANISM="" /LENGTH=174 /DNA_ID=CAMNT_0005360573 /DNA_START=20 /DNA_END=541 /DNA_ORIENTATION=-
MARLALPLMAAAAVAPAHGMTCPGSGSVIRAWCELTVIAAASCEDVLQEMTARVQGQGGWTDPHNGGIYSIISSADGILHTQRTTNPAKAFGGNTYTDKQDFTLTSVDGGCKIEGCSESQGFSVGDFSTNYCNLRNLYCGTADGCSPVLKDFASVESAVSKSLGAGHDWGACIV